MANTNKLYDPKFVFDHKADIEHAIVIDFKDLWKNKGQVLKKQIQYTRKEWWKTCDGTLTKPGTKPRVCGMWNGRGHFIIVNQGSPKNITCEEWKGAGRFFEDLCDDCEGSGYVSVTKQIEIEIPYSILIAPKQLLKCKSFGNQLGNKEFGNLYIKVNLINLDKRYEFKDNDIYSTHYVTISKAILGGVENFNTLYGQVEHVLPQKISYGDMYKLEGYGLPDPSGSGKMGNHYFTVKYEVPKNLSFEHRKLLVNWLSE